MSNAVKTINQINRIARQHKQRPVFFGSPRGGWSLNRNLDRMLRIGGFRDALKAEMEAAGWD